MRLLLDTCTFLWLVLDDPVIPAGVWELVRNPNNDLYLSVVAGWEMAIKYKAGKLALPEAPSVLSQSTERRTTSYRCPSTRSQSFRSRSFRSFIPIPLIE